MINQTIDHPPTNHLYHISWLFQLWRWEGDDPKRQSTSIYYLQLVTRTHIPPEWAETVTIVRKCGNVMQPVSLYQQATQIRHNPLSAAQASPAHRDRWDRVVFWRSDFVLKDPETAYAWPMHGHMHLDAIFLLYQELVASQRAQTQTSATHSRCIWPCLGHQLKI